MKLLSSWKKRLIIVGALLSIAGLTSIVVVGRLEESDSFCTSCHTVPEITYFNRAQAALAGDMPFDDLSSAHFVANAEDLPSGEPFRCIDCHRGSGNVTDRVKAIALGARDGITFLLGREDPTIEKTEIQASGLLTRSCVRCHTDILLEVGFENHFHTKLPDAFQALQHGGELTLPPDDPEANQFALEEGLKEYDTDIRCLDCHLAHFDVQGAELFFYLDVEHVVLFTCEQCHRDVDAGPLDLVPDQVGG